MGPLSPRSTAPNQTLDSSPTSTSPISTAVGAMKAERAIFGRLPRYSMIMSDASESRASNLAAMHKHRTPLRGVKATPHPKPGDPYYTAINYAYAGRTGRVHEIVEIDGKKL